DEDCNVSIMRAFLRILTRGVFLMHRWPSRADGRRSLADSPGPPARIRAAGTIRWCPSHASPAGSVPIDHNARTVYTEAGLWSATDRNTRTVHTEAAFWSARDRNTRTVHTEAAFWSARDRNTRTVRTEAAFWSARDRNTRTVHTEAAFWSATDHNARTVHT